MTTLLITLFGGWFGLHKFIEKKIGIGIIYLFTGGLFGIGWIYDTIKALMNILDFSSIVSLPSNIKKINNSMPESISGTDTEEQPLKYNHNFQRNKLYSTLEDSQSGNRWIVKYKYENVEVKKVDSTFSEYFEYDIVDIVPEPSNSDNIQISVRFHDMVLGYIINHKISTMIFDFLSRNEPMRAQIQKIEETLIFIQIFFYKKRSDVLAPQPSFIVKLISNNNQSMQDDISCCEVNDKVYAEYDIDKDKYLVTSHNCGCVLGYIPASKTHYLKSLEKDGYEFDGHITEITENESEILIVTVSIHAE